MKECTKCSTLLPASSFYSYDKRCKECIKAYTRKRHASLTQEQRDTYNAARRETLKKQREERTPEEARRLSLHTSRKRMERMAAMSDEQKTAYKEMKRRHAAERKARLSVDELEASKQRRNARMRKRYRNETGFRLKALLRTRLHEAIKNNHKSGSAVQDLGCSIEFLKTHLESKFQEGMTWDNHGSWHIDHIKPLASFDLTDRVQLQKACHYSNLQPLWKQDNLRKISSDLSQIKGDN